MSGLRKCESLSAPVGTAVPVPLPPPAHVPVPATVHLSSGPTHSRRSQNNLLFGAMCYAIGARAEQQLRSSIAADMPGAIAWSPRRSKAQYAKPIDKVMPNRLRTAGLKLAVAREPAFVRAPVSSLIHTQYDEKFMQTRRRTSQPPPRAVASGPPWPA